MANYMRLTPSSEKYIELLVPFDPALVSTIKPVDIELPQSVPRPDVDLEQMSIVTGQGMLQLSIYRPADSHDKVLPSVVYIHGGGWCMEKKGSYAYICSKIAGESQCAVIFVHYSLSPAVRFPVALEQCYGALQWATNLNNTQFLKLDPTRVAIAGESAGGNLAIAVTLLAKQRELPTKIKYQVLFYPVTDDQFNTASYYEFSTGYGVTRDIMKYCWDNYIPNVEDRSNILACPLKAKKEELVGLPPALIITAEADVLRDEAENFGRKLLSAGVPTTTTRILGVLHSFINEPALMSDESLFALDLATAALRRSFA